MNELRGRKVQKIESPVPGCLGRMVNLFDLGTAVNGNKMLTDKPHRDGNHSTPSATSFFTSPSCFSSKDFTVCDCLIYSISFEFGIHLCVIDMR